VAPPAKKARAKKDSPAATGEVLEVLAAGADVAPAAKKARAKKGSSAAASEVLEALAPAPKARAKAKPKEPVEPAVTEAAGLLALAPQAKKRAKAAAVLPGDAEPGLKRRRPRAGQEAALLADSEASSSDLLRALDVAGASLLSSSTSSN
jgi:hypothetical protein